MVDMPDTARGKWLEARALRRTAAEYVAYATELENAAHEQTDADAAVIREPWDDPNDGHDHVYHVTERWCLQCGIRERVADGKERG